MDDIKLKLKLYTYYIVIGVVSFLALVILPLVNSTIGLETSFPNTKIGWLVWGVTKGIVSLINILIFHSFVQQGKVNSLNNKNFIEANLILNKVRDKNAKKPSSPTKYLVETYSKKGTSLFFTTALSLVALSQAIFSYNWQDLITYGFTIAMGIVFGILTMLKVETYWQDEYLEYAKMIEEESKRD